MRPPGQLWGTRGNPMDALCRSLGTAPSMPPLVPGTSPSPGSPVPLESRTQWSSQTLQDCQRMINDQQPQNCPDCQFGCCLTWYLMSSDIFLQVTSHRQLGSVMEPGGAGARSCPPPKLPCAPHCS